MMIWWYMINPWWSKPGHARIKEIHHQTGDWDLICLPTGGVERLESPSKLGSVIPNKMWWNETCKTEREVQVHKFGSCLVFISNVQNVPQLWHYSKKDVLFHYFSQIGEAQTLRIHLWSSKPPWSHCQSPSGDFPTDDIKVHCGANRVEQLETGHGISEISMVSTTN